MMAAPRPIYTTGVTVFGFTCLVLGCISLFLPVWGHFEDRHGGYQAERGYFGPWRVCKNLNYGREICGDRFRFQVSGGVYVSGVLSMMSCISLALFSVFSIIQLAMITSRDEVVLKFKTCVILKLVLAIISALMALSAALLFAIEIDNINRSFIVTRGTSFYLQILLVVLSIGLSVVALYDVIFAFRVSGDPTRSIVDMVASATTINNPGYREGRSGISVTDSSGKPYGGTSSINTNGQGSVLSMSTTVTSVSNGSTFEIKSPLRSSLKKPRNRDALGIQNPGFSGANQSPRMNRTASVKKVRIQTHSTEV